MTLALLIYLVLGPLAWAALLVAGAFAGRRMGRLSDAIAPLPATAPTLTVLVPVKDEIAGIASCVSGIRALDYPSLDVVVIDDRSTDGTSDALDELAGRSLRVIHLRDLPPGWLGKCHALHVGTRGVTSDWLLFIDSDMTVASESARLAIAICEERGWDALSLLPTLQAQSFWERLLLPLLGVSWAAAFRVPQTNDDSRPDRAFASGGFFLIRRSWYERVGGHESVRALIVEDISLMRTLKRAGAKVRLQFGQHLVGARMHATLDEIYRGWARILAGTTSRRVGPLIAVIAWICICGFSLVPALLMGLRSTPWLVASLTHAVLMALFAARVYRTSRQPVWLGLMLPVSLPVLLSVYANAVRVCRSGRVAWRGCDVEVA